MIPQSFPLYAVENDEAVYLVIGWQAGTSLGGRHNPFVVPVGGGGPATLVKGGADRHLFG